jgi:hypothetical protein
VTSPFFLLVKAVAFGQENAIGKEPPAPVYGGIARPTETTGESILWSSPPFVGVRDLARTTEVRISGRVIRKRHIEKFCQLLVAEWLA